MMRLRLEENLSMENNDDDETYYSAWDGVDWDKAMTEAGIHNPNPTVAGLPGRGWALVADPDLVSEDLMRKAMRLIKHLQDDGVDSDD